MWLPLVNHKKLTCRNMTQMMNLWIPQPQAMVLPGVPLVSQNVGMAKSKKTTGKDRHKPSRLVRLRAAIARQAEKLVERNSTDLTEEANRAMRLLLESEGLWPPPPASESAKAED